MRRFRGVFVLVLVTAGIISLTDAAQRVDLRVGASFVVEPPMARYVRELDERELREQVRDWAVIATVARASGSPEQAAAATYELPPARLPYLEELYTFEYGRGRRVYLGPRVLLFRDGDDPDPQATIGRLADRVRMENGEIPSKVEIYLVHDQHGSIRIERAADVTGAELLSPKYGYVEGYGDDVHALVEWLGKTDDLSSVQIENGRLMLGGRRFPKTSTANLTAEEVAALYQAHEQLEAPRRQARVTLASLPPDVRTAAERLRQVVESGAPREEVERARAALSLRLGALPGIDAHAIFSAIKTAAQPPRSPGFSLDPRWLPDPANPQHPLMLSRLRAFAADPCGNITEIARRAVALETEEPDPTRRTASTRKALEIRDLRSALLANQTWPHACGALRTFVSRLHGLGAKLTIAKPDAWDSALAGYYQLLDEWQQLPIDDPDKVAAKIAIPALAFHEHESRAQCGRYEGTAGTRVGMTMFYTDLLAKLWKSIDYGRSAPLADVAGFSSSPRLDLDPAFLSDARKYPTTRIWFGPRANGVSRASRDRFFFNHTFARIYAAGTHPMYPGREARPREDSRRTIGWWDRHFDEVASYEQEYHRLNQIMKWSLVTATLAESTAARYLGSVLVRRDQKFLDWQRTNRARLRFSESLPVVGSSPAGAECMPLLSSYSFTSMGQRWTVSGGVDTAALDAPAKIATIDPSKAFGARLPRVDSLTGDRSGTAMRAHPALRGKDVHFLDAVDAPTRDLHGDVALGTPTVSYGRGAGLLEIHVGEAAHAIGVLSADAGKLRWSDGPIERQRRFSAAVQ